MKCINCGATIEGTISGTLSKCDYCGTTNAFVIRTLFDETGSTQDEITANQKKFQQILNDIDAGEYEDAYDSLVDFSLTHDDNWQVHANLALCKFWLGDDSFYHLTDVVKHLKKALNSHTTGIEVQPFVKAISYNVAQISVLKNRFGQALAYVSNALEQMKILVPDYPERDILISKFVNDNTDALLRDLWTLIKRDKKNFDPPNTLIETLVNLISLDPSANKEATALALIAVEQKKQKPQKITVQYEMLRSSYLKLSHKNEIPKIVYPMFGSPKIEY
jgi:hypothetical protein